MEQDKGEHKRHNDIIIRKIEYGSDEYHQELKLRNEILRKPLNLNIHNEDLASEKEQIHFGAFHEKKLIAVLVIKKLNDKEVKIRQVVVRKKYQGSKIGTRIMNRAEEYALQQGFVRIKLKARRRSAGFYIKLGYQRTGEETWEVTLPHWPMFKELT